ncbi:adenosylcobinamide-phosphate synthase CbiB [Vibrio penaeicida]|uniref:adenosylcobinamide-phosphate synthase CbiB n=1 Tax=Vibrio penaeicida TaxID=104609 RepID=UPI000CEA278D|nr:adenosylcobinamide-phosphate synthase CbiB [Vibrio penaeicida]
MDWWLHSVFAPAIAVCGALLLDTLFGEPKKWHPLIGFGNIVYWVEEKLNTPATRDTLISQIQGIAAWLLAVFPIVGGLFWGVSLVGNVSFVWNVCLDVAILYVCIGQKSLLDHAGWIHQPLQAGDLGEAREKVGWIVSRETEQMSEYQITSAAIESVLENGNDAVFGTLFWFILLGAPGAILFRLANTLDAMWGYKSPRFNSFGFFAAKADDFMGYLPAKATAYSYAILGNTKNAMKCWKAQAKSCSSPNGGPVMTSGAGALNIKIGGPAMYHGKMHDKIYMGSGDLAKPEDIPRACRLIVRTSLLWCSVLIVLALAMLDWNAVLSGANL